jgi:hypothetical protein
MQSSRPARKLADDLKSTRDDLDQKEDVKLEQLWADAKVILLEENTWSALTISIQKNFLEKTGSSLDDVSFNTHISDEVEKILSVEDKEDNKDDKDDRDGRRKYIKRIFSNAKKVFSRVFKVIWKFSDFFLPMATSIPFVGSGVTLLTKAIELLIQTTKDYREIFVKAAELFEQVGFFSMRFEMLMEAERDGAKVHQKFVSAPCRLASHESIAVSYTKIEKLIVRACIGSVSQCNHRAHCRLCGTIH